MAEKMSETTEEIYAYVLDADKVAHPATFDEYIKDSRRPGYRESRRVGLTTLPDGREVSTVFLALDHGSLVGPPILFETMVFPEQDICDRYSTWQEAEEGHARIVAEITAAPSTNT